MKLTEEKYLNTKIVVSEASSILDIQFYQKVSYHNQGIE